MTGSITQVISSVVEEKEKLRYINQLKFEDLHTYPFYFFYIFSLIIKYCGRGFPILPEK